MTDQPNSTEKRFYCEARVSEYLADTDEFVVYDRTVSPDSEREKAIFFSGNDAQDYIDTLNRAPSGNVSKAIDGVFNHEFLDPIPSGNASDLAKDMRNWLNGPRPPNFDRAKADIQSAGVLMERAIGLAALQSTERVSKEEFCPKCKMNENLCNMLSPECDQRQAVVSISVECAEYFLRKMKCRKIEVSDHELARMFSEEIEQALNRH